MKKMTRVQFHFFRIWNVHSWLNLKLVILNFKGTTNGKSGNETGHFRGSPVQYKSSTFHQTSPPSSSSRGSYATLMNRQSPSQIESQGNSSSKWRSSSSLRTANMFEKKSNLYASEENRSESQIKDESQPVSEDDTHASANVGRSSHAKGATVRVAKACVPCSTKKRRCDGGKPECKVCVVLRTPCTYESKGLKRGPPKGFRSGPKESARARLLRSLETTIRDLSLQMGTEETGSEILRISQDRGISLASSEAGPSSKKMKRSISEPSGKDEAEDGGDEQEDFLGINEQGSVRHFGSSSGIQLIHTQSPCSLQRPSNLRDANQRMTIPSNSNTSAYPLPTVPNRLHGIGSNTSRSDSPLHSPVQGLHQQPPAKWSIHVSVELNRKLFYSYWEGFHPFWPVLYKPAFDELSLDQLPVLLDDALLNAIYAIAVCVASPPLDPEVESELGDSPAGEVFFHRAESRLFGGHTTPSPSLSSIQVCFFLALYCQGSGQLSKAWIFSSLANSMSFDLGLHRHLHHFNNNAIEKESRVRLIHCVYILSTILSAEMGRPPMMKSKDVDVPLLSENEKDEFELDQQGNELHSPTCLNSSLRLFSIVETVLSQVHSFRRKAALRKVGSDSTRAVVKEISQRLETWRKTLSEPLKLSSDRDSSSLRLLPNSIAVHLWYHTAVLLLNRPFIPHEEGSSLQEVLNDPCHIKCTKASNELFELLLQLSNSNDVDRLSTDLAYCIFTAAVMFLFNARLGQTVPSNDDTCEINSKSNRVVELSNEAKMRFLMCKEWLRGLSSRWPAASAHKQLLDGFSSVGEDVLRGTKEAEEQKETQPWNTQGGSAKSWNVSSEREMRRGALDAPHEQIDGPALEYNDSSRFINNTTGNSYSDVDLKLMGQNYRGEGSQYMYYPTISNSSIALPEQHQQQQQYQFAPNIFDMESVFWNETAAARSPLSQEATKNNALQRPQSAAGLNYNHNTTSMVNTPPTMQSLLAVPSNQTIPTTATANGLQMLAQATTAGLQVSPFSFHQETSQPEWQDLINVLQLPPAFLQ